MRRILPIILLNCILIKVNSQVDSSNMLYSAKMQLTVENGVNSPQEWDKYLSLYDARFLNSKGFEGFYFILLENKIKDDSLMAIKEKDYYDNLVFNECVYILATDKFGQMFYKLKGFRNNDISLFIKKTVCMIIVPGFLWKKMI